MFSFTAPTSRNNNQKIFEIELNPHNHHNKNSNHFLNSINNKWFINLSHTNIPHKVQCLLQLGQNFSLPSINTKNNIIQLIKNIENNIIKLQPDTQNEIRNRSIPMLYNLISKSFHKVPIDNKITNLTKLTNKFIKNNPNIIFYQSR